MRHTGAVLLAACLVGSLFAAGCWTGSRPSTHNRSDLTCAIMVLFDVSGSTSAKAIRQRYYDDLHDKVLYAPGGARKIQSRFVGGEIILGDVITDNSLATASFPVDKAFPVYNQWETNPMDHEIVIKDATEQVCKAAHRLIFQSNPGKRTDLMNAFQLVDKMLNGERCGSAQHKVLIVFSDMIEQSQRYDFLSERLTRRRCDQIIQRERKAGYLPNLHGVRVWVAGATASTRGGVDPRKIHDIQEFWITYFKACGADLASDRYAATLINFELPTRRQ